jgi:hypothetical protein
MLADFLIDEDGAAHSRPAKASAGRMESQPCREFKLKLESFESCTSAEGNSSRVAQARARAQKKSKYPQQVGRLSCALLLPLSSSHIPIRIPTCWSTGATVTSVHCAGAVGAGRGPGSPIALADQTVPVRREQLKKICCR